MIIEQARTWMIQVGYRRMMKLSVDSTLPCRILFYPSPRERVGRLGAEVRCTLAFADCGSNISLRQSDPLAQRSDEILPGSSTVSYLCNSASSALTSKPVISTQFAFILNLEQHWFTLRSFGDHAAQGQGHTHWFNLNSFLQRPEWVSKTYLGMMLQQAESEGSIPSRFVSTTADISPARPLRLLRLRRHPRGPYGPLPSTLFSRRSSLRNLRTEH